MLIKTSADKLQRTRLHFALQFLNSPCFQYVPRNKRLNFGKFLSDWILLLWLEMMKNPIFELKIKLNLMKVGHLNLKERCWLSSFVSHAPKKMFHMLITFVLLVSVSIILSAQPGFKTLLRTILTNSEVIALDFQIKQGVLLAVHYFVVFPL